MNTTPDDPIATARRALACLDLTRLNGDDTEADIERLCQRAGSRFGPVAAVCVWPRLAGFARRQLPASIRVAAVANFPEGDADPERALRDIAAIAEAGAQEVDVVLPWRALLAGDTAACARVLAAARRASTGLTLKVILESGELRAPERIAEASRLALAEGADFLKTSTGKTPTGATPEAARVMLEAIAADRASRAGFKASGGVRTVADAASYLALVAETLGEAACTPARFRIGASGLLDDIEAVLGGSATLSAGAGY
ncbi:deoxyribose-phosphate aldolase [Ideonella sp.]|uniref:deoxyribose-phosphate aldolase n=1 Tax=Ideonella sp. TaxID=1929293 RepID=UPI002B45DE72|nr:deoxyribose-phosphate aldolase [Ideonella sp.]HJV70824.1 deoxyribose-phosphate aldolase [Ideonella sp.]